MSDSFPRVRVDEAVERRLANLQRRLVASRVAVEQCREEGAHHLADVMEGAIDNLNLEVLAWQQWRLEGFGEPSLESLRRNF